MVHHREMSDLGSISIGVAASIGPELAGRLAPLIEEAGFHAFWVNDTPGADALVVLQAAAGVTEDLSLATGVLAVDRRPAAEIARQVQERDLPQHRLVLGIGSGQAKKGALQLVSDAAAELLARIQARVVVGALGPKMRLLAAEESDGVLLSWLNTTTAREQAAQAHAAAPGAHVALYVRAAFDPAAEARLREETARYARYRAYAANFARLGMSDYRQSADEVVLRAITVDDTLDAYLSFIDEARQLL
jgi:alkanesulfonate monooxygenase SsuD/methylene tetrahydromethanopterin reductase-like flavin-dependent oxidoreductase (luciferase family)